jgi:hypothetical protein
MIISTRQTSEGKVLTEPDNINPCQDEWCGDRIAGPLAAEWDELMRNSFFSLVLMIN